MHVSARSWLHLAAYRPKEGVDFIQMLLHYLSSPSVPLPFFFSQSLKRSDTCEAKCHHTSMSVRRVKTLSHLLQRRIRGQVRGIVFSQKTINQQSLKLKGWLGVMWEEINGTRIIFNSSSTLSGQEKGSGSGVEVAVALPSLCMCVCMCACLKRHFHLRAAWQADWGYSVSWDRGQAEMTTPAQSNVRLLVTSADWTLHVNSCVSHPRLKSLSY